MNEEVIQKLRDYKDRLITELDEHWHSPTIEQQIEDSGKQAVLDFIDYLLNEEA